VRKRERQGVRVGKAGKERVGRESLERKKADAAD
jgi:hypothetical protein